MKSELEKQNSWQTFVERAERAVREKDFRIRTIRSIFRFVDPEFDSEPLGFKNAFLYFIYWNTSLKGRRIRYLRAVELFLKRKKTMFRDAPKRVIDVYNALIQQMFAPSDAAPLLIPSSWARKQVMSRAEKFIAYSEKAEASYFKNIKEFQHMFADLEGEPAVSDERFELQLERTLKPATPPPKTRPYPYSLFRDIPSEDQDALDKRKKVYEDLQYRKQTFRQNLLQLQREYREIHVENLEKELVALSLDGDFFEEGVSSVDAAHRIDDLETRMSAVEKQLTSLWTEKSFQILESTERVASLSIRLSLLLWPAVSEELVWRDLAERLPSVKESLFPLFKNIFHTNSSRESCETLLFDMTQLEDIRSLEGELAHRAARQKDLIQAVMTNVRKACVLRAVSFSIGETATSVRLKALIDEMVTWVYSFLTPRTTYGNLMHREEVFVLFRNAWISLEPLFAEIVSIEEKMEKEWSLDQAEQFARHTALFLTDVDAASLFEKPLYNEFRTFFNSACQAKSWSPFFQWLDRFGCGVFSLPLPAKERTASIQQMVACRQKIDELLLLKQKLLYSFYGDSSYIEFLFWSTQVLFDTITITHPGDDDRVSRLASQVKTAFLVWEMSIPSPMRAPGKEPLSLSTDVVSQFLSWSTGRKTQVFLNLVRFHHEIVLLRQQGDATSISQAVHQSSLERQMWEDLLCHGFTFSNTYLQDQLPDQADVKEEVASSLETSIPMVGDVGMLVLPG